MLNVLIILGLYTIIGAAFCRIAYADYVSFRIDNGYIIILICLYVFFYMTTFVISLDANILSSFFAEEFKAFTLFEPKRDLIAAALLFATGFVLWLMRLLGAGDAKLLFPIGLFTGMEYLMPFAIALILFGAAVFIILKLPNPAPQRHNKFRARLAEIRETGKVPYGVILSAAVLVTLVIKYGAAIR